MGCLVDAVRRGDVQEVARLLAAGADPNVKDPDGDAPLHVAAEQCRADLAELLLKHSADPNARDAYGRTPLHRAACLDVADLLIRHGADVNARDGKGYTPATHAFMRGDLDVAAFLLSHGATADVEAAESPDGVALAGDRIPAGEALLQAVVFAEQVDAVYLLLSRGADPNVRGWRGQTPLHLAIVYEGTSNCRTNVVWLLLKHGADPNLRDEHGKTPLHYAAEHCMPDLVELLLKHGADPNARDAEGRTPLYTVFERAANDRWERVMAELTAAALLRHGADPNARDLEGRTPLHYAAARNHKAAAELLLKHGADPNARDESGETPLDLAAKWCAAETGALLAAYGLGPLTLSHAVEAGCVDLVKALPPVNDKQALSAAAWFCDVDVARVLLERWAEADALEAALESAVAAGCVEVVELLLSWGARLRAGLFSLAEYFRRGEVVKVLAKYADRQTLEKALSNCFVMALAVETPEEAARQHRTGAPGIKAPQVERSEAEGRGEVLVDFRSGLQQYLSRRMLPLREFVLLHDKPKQRLALCAGVGPGADKPPQQVGSTVRLEEEVAARTHAPQENPQNRQPP